MRNAAARAFADKWDSAKENARFYRLLQYSDPQLARISADKRVPYVLDYVTSAINTYLGVQRDQRTDIAYFPAKQEDEVKAEVLNAVKDATLRRNGFEHLESDIFQDGIVEKGGAIGYEWTTERNPLGELNTFRIPIRQLSWDLNRREYSVQTSSWVSRTRLYQKRVLAAKFPDHAKEIMKLSIQSNILDGLSLDDSYMKQIVDSELDSIALIEFYEKDYKDKYFLVNTTTGDVLDEDFSTKKDAERALREHLNEYEQATVPRFQQMGIMPPSAPEYTIRPESVPIIRKSEIIHYLTLTAEEEIDEPFYPYDVYYPYWHDGEWWGVLDTFKDAQRFINKMFMMVDHQITTGAKGLLLIDDSIPQAEAADLMRLWSTTGGAKTIKDPKNNVHFIPPSSFDPRLLTAMDVAITNLEKKAGGANFLGHRETASESGVAVKERISQGSLTSFVVFDNLSRWKKEVGHHLQWYLTNFMTAPQKVRLEGKELTDAAAKNFPQWFEPSSKNSYGFMTVNTVKENSLEGLEADTIVDEAKHSVTKNQAVLAQLNTSMQSSPVLAETIPPQMIISLMDIPATEKEKWMSYANQMLEQKQAMDKANAQKPPAISGSLKDMEALPFETQRAFFQKFFGIDLPQPVKSSADAAIEGKMVDTMAKQHIEDRRLAFDKIKHEDQTALKAVQISHEHKQAMTDLEQKKNGEGKNAV